LDQPSNDADAKQDRHDGGADVVGQGARKSESTQASRSDIRYPDRIPIMARMVPKLWIGPDLFRHGIGGHGFQSIASEPLAPTALTSLDQDQEPGRCQPTSPSAVRRLNFRVWASIGQSEEPQAPGNGARERRVLMIGRQRDLWRSCLVSPEQRPESRHSETAALGRLC